jgi:hypothetical protein
MKYKYNSLNRILVKIKHDSGAETHYQKKLK